MTLSSFTSGAELFAMDEESETWEWVGGRNREPFLTCLIQILGGVLAIQPVWVSPCRCPSEPLPGFGKVMLFQFWNYSVFFWALFLKLNDWKCWTKTCWRHWLFTTWNWQWSPDQKWKLAGTTGCTGVQGHTGTIMCQHWEAILVLWGFKVNKGLGEREMESSEIVVA